MSVVTPLALVCLGVLQQTGRAHVSDQSLKRAISAAKETKQETKEHKSLTGLVCGAHALLHRGII